MRAMTHADLDAVLAIEQSVQAYPWTRGNFEAALNLGYACHVEEQAGRVRGYAVLMPVVDEAELLNIGVEAGRQHKGLGRAMLSEMLALAIENMIRRVYLEVRASNAAALALYRRAGFVEIGLRRGYYQNANGREDAITMACELTKNLPSPQAEQG